MKCLRCAKTLGPDRIDFGYCLECSEHFRDYGDWPAFDGNPAHLHRIVVKEGGKEGEGDEVCVCGYEEDAHEA